MNVIDGKRVGARSRETTLLRRVLRRVLRRCLAVGFCSAQNKGFSEEEEEEEEEEAFQKLHGTPSWRV